MFGWIKKLQSSSRPRGLEREMAAISRARKHFLATAKPHIKSDHWALIVQNPLQNLLNEFVRPQAADWQHVALHPVDLNLFTQVTFSVNQIKYPETLVRVLIPLDDPTGSIYESSWYPDGDLKVSHLRQVELQHHSTLAPEALVKHFILSEHLSEWMAGGMAAYATHYDGVIQVMVGQSHYFTLRLLTQTEHCITFMQTWLDAYGSLITITLLPVDAGTDITVQFSGIISIYTEQDYISDWSLHLIP